MLTRIITHDTEPMGDLDVPLAPRLNLLCGDNGLGKTFLIDLAWWALTESWSRYPAMPRRGNGAAPSIRCELYQPPGDLGPGHAQQVEGHFNFDEQRWTREGFVHPLVVYARADGSFDVWDSFRRAGAKGTSSLDELIELNRSSFDPTAVWDGLVLDDRTVRCNGLLRDWVAWQFQKPALFDLLSRVIARLSPHPDEILRPGPPQRISIEDARDIPTLILPYGTVPVTHASAGMRRILALAYMLVWAWNEHTEAARLRNTAPLDELVLLFDEVEAHLHPQWQRAILPALFQAISEMRASLSVQILASTHAPLVLASVETLFDEARDQLLHFGLIGDRIVVEPIPWAKQGDAVNWLVSETFGLTQARSRDAERAIEAAEAFMRGAPTPPDLASREAIHAELQRVLAGHDDFWPRWLVGTGAVK
ncbi:MAG: ATP-binding protein [Byssovorax sp.]